MVEHDGTRLGRLMQRAGINKTTLAEAVDVSDAAVGKWIRDGAIARDRIVPICRALGCSSDELLGLAPMEDAPRSAPTPIFTKERRAGDDVEALRIAVQSTAKAILSTTPASAGVFLAEMTALAGAQSFSTEQGLLGRLAGIATAVQSSAGAGAPTPQPDDPVRRTRRGK